MLSTVLLPRACRKVSTSLSPYPQGPSEAYSDADWPAPHNSLRSCWPCHPGPPEQHCHTRGQARQIMSMSALPHLTGPSKAHHCAIRRACLSVSSIYHQNSWGLPDNGMPLCSPLVPRACCMVSSMTGLPSSGLPDAAVTQVSLCLQACLNATGIASVY